MIIPDPLFPSLLSVSSSLPDTKSRSSLSPFLPRARSPSTRPLSSLDRFLLVLSLCLHCCRRVFYFHTFDQHIHLLVLLTLYCLQRPVRGSCCLSIHAHRSVRPCICLCIIVTFCVSCPVFAAGARFLLVLFFGAPQEGPTVYYQARPRFI